MNSSLAPIAVFAYKRPEHLKKTLESLSKCSLADQSALFIFCDGAKEDSDLEFIERTREVAKSQKWPREIQVIEQPKNLGLSKSISTGVTTLCEKFGKIIVVEDDLRVAPSFLEYMNEALNLYKDDEKVMEISGYMYPVETKGDHDAFFMMHASCWGWGTWQRAWRHFGDHPDEVAKLKSDSKLRHKFDMNGAYAYYKMLEKQLDCEIDSWGVLWYLTLFKMQGLVLMPRKTLVENIGQDNTGTHVSEVHFKDSLSDFRVQKFPPVNSIDDKAAQAVRAIISKNNPGLFRKIFNIKNRLTQGRFRL